MRQNQKNSAWLKSHRTSEAACAAALTILSCAEYALSLHDKADKMMYFVNAFIKSRNEAAQYVAKPGVTPEGLLDEILKSVPVNQEDVDLDNISNEEWLSETTNDMTCGLIYLLIGQMAGKGASAQDIESALKKLGDNTYGALVKKANSLIQEAKTEVFAIISPKKAA